MAEVIHTPSVLSTEAGGAGVDGLWPVLYRGLCTCGWKAKTANSTEARAMERALMHARESPSKKVEHVPSCKGPFKAVKPTCSCGWVGRKLSRNSDEALERARQHAEAKEAAP